MAQFGRHPDFCEAGETLTQVVRCAEFSLLGVYWESVPRAAHTVQLALNNEERQNLVRSVLAAYGLHESMRISPRMQKDLCDKVNHTYQAFVARYDTTNLLKHVQSEPPITMQEVEANFYWYFSRMLTVWTPKAHTAVKLAIETGTVTDLIYNEMTVPNAYRLVGMMVRTALVSDVERSAVAFFLTRRGDVSVAWPKLASKPFIFPNNFGKSLRTPLLRHLENTVLRHYAKAALHHVVYGRVQQKGDRFRFDIFPFRDESTIAGYLVLIRSSTASVLSSQRVQTGAQLADILSVKLAHLHRVSLTSRDLPKLL